MDLEPAERNPAELRKTALMLVAVMIVGAVGILAAYHIKSRAQAQENPDRPPLVAKLTYNFGAKNQDDKVVGIADLEGKVWLAALVAVGQPEQNKLAIDEMLKLAERYKDNADVRFVLLSVDSADHGVDPAQLAAEAERRGLKSPQWWLLASSNTEEQRGYIKDQLRLGLVSERLESDPERELLGRWKFPSLIALIDRKRHLRQRYDFREALDAQEKVASEVEKNPELKKQKNVELYLRAVPLLREKMIANTDFVLAEEAPGTRGKADKEKKP